MGAIFVLWNEPKTCLGSECVSATGEPLQIVTMAKYGAINLIDVREENEWSEGHIEGAALIPLGSISENSTLKLSKEVPTYVYCRSGRRAGVAVDSFKTLGFKNVINLGGVIDWQEKGGVLVK